MMPKVRSNPSDVKWIKLDSKQQGNSHELVDLVKTIKGVEVKEEPGVYYVLFPEEVASPSVRRRAFALFPKRQKKHRISHHYSAIILKQDS